MPDITFITTLPLKFQSFSSVRDGNNSKLSWKMADNTAMQKFEVMFSSNGISYQRIASVNVSDQKLDYSYTDIAREGKSLYYKIAALELSGLIIYSPVQRMSTADHSSFTLLGNPVKQFSTINISFTNKRDRLISIHNSIGRLISTYKSQDMLLKISTAGLSRGLYILKVEDERGSAETCKLVID